MPNYIGLFVILLLPYCAACMQELTVVIRNMHYISSQQKAAIIKQNLLQDAKVIESFTVNVLALHEGWAPGNGWTILPLFRYLYENFKTRSRWIFFCEDTTNIKLKSLVSLLSKFDHNEKLFLGHSLHDGEASIIHHFAFHNNPSSFKFPDFDAGWAVSMKLIKHSLNRLNKNPPEMGFSIDVKHEVAMFFYDGGKGTLLTHVPEFCINKQLEDSNCVSAVQYEKPNCGVVDPDDILVAVKTCQKYHDTRVPYVKKTIGLYAKHIQYYSDVADNDIPTKYIGVNNTDSGHCQKLRNIIKTFTTKEWLQQKWLVIIDDDTIMNFKRLQQLLACYDYKQPILLGERYAYGINYNDYGYSYPTGGGGMVLSRKGVEALFSIRCTCHSDDSPDDMWLGSCFRNLHIPMVHTNSFHQTRPSQYSDKFLSHRYLVSFHKHDFSDPLQVYREYLTDQSGFHKVSKEEL